MKTYLFGQITWLTPKYMLDKILEKTYFCVRYVVSLIHKFRDTLTDVCNSTRKITLSLHFLTF